MKVSVLSVRSFAVADDDLEAAKDELRAALASRSEIVTVDAARAIFEAGSPRWKEADQLFFAGVNAYGELRYAEAVESLKSSLAISTASYREYSGLEGRSRVRETCLYLGLAKLEQGADDANDWFARAARTQPGFEPDEKEFSPRARKAWEQARAQLAGAPMETSLEQLDVIGARIGADVVVTAGVSVAPDGHASLQVVIGDRREHASTEKAIQAPSAKRDDLVRAMRKGAQEIIAQILHEDPSPGVRRFNLTGGVETRWTPNTQLVAIVSGGTGLSRYVWRSALIVGGGVIGIDGLAVGPVRIAPAVGFIPPQPMRGTFVITPQNAASTGDVLYGITPRVYAMPCLLRGRWLFGAGVGGEATIAAFAMRSSQSVALTTWVRRSVGAEMVARTKIGPRATVQATAGGGYDLGGGSGRVTWRLGVLAGTSF